MKNTIILSLSTDTAGVIVGNLLWDSECLLSMKHPTTIAAAIFAIGEEKVVFLTDTMEPVQFPFPISVRDMCALLQLAKTKNEADFIVGLAKSSWFDFVNPHQADIQAQAEFHLAAAVSHLPKRLVRNGPSSSKPKGFADELRTGDRPSPFSPD